MMNSPISFGRSIRVSAPIEYADKLAKMANGTMKAPSKQVSSKLSEVFSDIQNGKAQAFSRGPSTSYILTGKESVEAGKISSAFDKFIENIKTTLVGEEKEIELFKAYGKYYNGINSLIDRTKEPGSIVIGEGKIYPNNEITHIDFIA